ncbi:hypothetical protein C7447_102620 [Tenacibaculum adriaticum]|uniref:Uncharacterized protein n=1 Tax=Tenacibaculum adriaticum TaxID=413713 RepID=A0A5S5DVJ8_9FLAO|nr:hypothetical protein C7447_102620 [Tenacibaculum adriaticum]
MVNIIFPLPRIYTQTLPLILYLVAINQTKYNENNKIFITNFFN